MELTAYDPSNTTFFDLDGDGFAEQTGWVTGDDGFLALDINGNFEIDDATELFGTATGFGNGFTALATLDSNNDGVIDAGDEQFANLLIWKDTNANAISEFDELFTLADFGITAIDLGYSETNLTIAGHDVPFVSTVTFADNSTSVIGDVFFNHDEVNTRYTADFDGDLRTIFMPELRGYGELANLRVAMSLDNDIDDPASLLSLVKELTFKSSLDQLLTSDDSVLNEVRDILFRWAGVDGVDPASRAGNSNNPDFDSRELEFLEKLLGQDYLQRGIHSDPYHLASVDIQEAFHNVLNEFYARLLTQIVGDELFTTDGTHELGLGNDPLQPLFDPAYDAVNDDFIGITGLNADAIAALEAEAAVSSDPAALWQNVLRMVEFTIGTDNLAGDDYNALNLAIAGTTGSTVAEVLSSLDFVVDSAGDSIRGTSGDDVLTGTAFDDRLSGDYGDDIINGGLGNDTIFGGPDDDILIGGAGADLIYGDSGNDTFVYNLGDGIDTYRESNESSGSLDIIQFGAGIALSDLSLSRVGNTDMVIKIETPEGVTGQILLENHFNFAAGGGNIDLLTFDDGTTLDPDTLNWTMFGTEGDDSLSGVTFGRGGGPDDTIFGMGGPRREADGVAMRVRQYLSYKQAANDNVGACRAVA